MTIALYPGSFDPITNGHLDIATRAVSLFDELIIGIYDTPGKRLLFTTNERLEMVKEAISHLPKVRAEAYSCLTVEFARMRGARVLIRGLRMSSDFEREFEMTLMNKQMAPDLDTICLMTSIEYQFLSSSLLKEVSELGGNIELLVPKHVAVALRKKFISY